VVAATVLAVAAIAAPPAPPDLHALTLRRGDVPSGWSSAKAAPGELGGCRRVPHVSRAYSPRLFKVTSQSTQAAGSRATVYATQALARREIRLVTDPKQRACFERSLVGAMRRAFGPTARVAPLAVRMPPEAAAAIGYLVSYRYRGIFVKAYYEYVYIARGRIVSQLLVFGVFRRVDAALIRRLTGVLARRAARTGSAP
jgi:hypothetical protein